MFSGLSYTNIKHSGEPESDVFWEKKPDPTRCLPSSGVLLALRGRGCLNRVPRFPAKSFGRSRKGRRAREPQMQLQGCCGSATVHCLSHVCLASRPTLRRGHAPLASSVSGVLVLSQQETVTQVGAAARAGEGAVAEEEKSKLIITNTYSFLETLIISSTSFFFLPLCTDVSRPLLRFTPCKLHLARPCLLPTSHRLHATAPMVKTRSPA